MPKSLPIRIFNISLLFKLVCPRVFVKGKASNKSIQSLKDNLYLLTWKDLPHVFRKQQTTEQHIKQNPIYLKFYLYTLCTREKNIYIVSLCRERRKREERETHTPRNMLGRILLKGQQLLSLVFLSNFTLLFVFHSIFASDGIIFVEQKN